MTLAQAIDAAFIEPSMASTVGEYVLHHSNGDLEALTGWIMSATDHVYERATVRRAVMTRAVHEYAPNEQLTAQFTAQCINGNPNSDGGPSAFHVQTTDTQGDPLLHIALAKERNELRAEILGVRRWLTSVGMEGDSLIVQVQRGVSRPSGARDRYLSTLKLIWEACPDGALWLQGILEAQIPEMLRSWMTQVTVLKEEPQTVNEGDTPASTDDGTDDGSRHLRVVPIKADPAGRDHHVEECVIKIEELLVRAKQGKVSHIILMGMEPNGTFGFHWTALAGRETISIGAVEVMKKIILDTITFTK